MDKERLKERLFKLFRFGSEETNPQIIATERTAGQLTILEQKTSKKPVRVSWEKVKLSEKTAVFQVSLLDSGEPRGGTVVLTPAEAEVFVFMKGISGEEREEQIGFPVCYAVLVPEKRTEGLQRNLVSA